MKKLFLAAAIVLGLASHSFAAYEGRPFLAGGHLPGATYQVKKKYGDQRDRIPKADHLTFAVDWDRDTYTPWYARFDGKAIKGTNFASTRNASQPASTTDSVGNSSVVTDSDVARYPKSYWDSTGVHFTRGILVEGSAANLLKDSYFAGATITDNWQAAGAAANESIELSSTYPNPYLGGNVCKLITDGASSYIIGKTAVNRAAVTSGTVYTASALVRGSGNVKIGLWDGTSDLLGSSVALTDSWNLIHYSVASGGTGSSASPEIIAQGAITCYIAFIKLEAGAYPSSFIPTTTAALTRPAESLNYPAVNFPDRTGNWALSFDGSNDIVTSASSINAATTGSMVFDILTRAGIGTYRIFATYGSGADACFLVETTSPNTTVVFRHINSSSDVFLEALTTSWTHNVWHRVVVTWKSTGEITGYIDGTKVLDKTSTVNSINKPIQLGYIGSGTNYTDMEMRGFRMYSSVLSQTDVNNIQAGNYPSGNKLVEWKMDEGTGTTIADSSGNNNTGNFGASTAAPTWVRDSHSFCVALRYAPVMLPSEQDASYKSIFIAQCTGTNYWNLFYDTNANNRILFTGKSNDNNSFLTSSSLAAWTRYSDHTIIAMGSTTPFVISTLNSGNPIKMALFDNGTAIAYSASYVPPVGSLPATFSIQSSAGQSAIYKKLRIWDCVFDLNGVKQITAEMAQ